MIFAAILALTPWLPSVSAASPEDAKGPVTPHEMIDHLYLHRHQGVKLENSIEKIEGLLKESSQDPDLLWRLGRSLVRFGERQKEKAERIRTYKKAEESLRRSVEIAPDGVDAHYWLGVAMGRHGQSRGILKSLFMLDDLKKEMKTTLRLDPAHGGAHHVLGEMYMQLPGFVGGSKKEALKELRMAVELDPDNTSHYTPLAEAYLKNRKKDEAIETLKRVFLVEEPADPGEYDDNIKDAREMLAELE